MSFRSHIWSAILTVTICTPISAIAGNPELMRQLKQTKSCNKGNLVAVISNGQMSSALSSVVLKT